MELKASLPCSQQPATGTSPEPDVSSPQFRNLFPQDAWTLLVTNRWTSISGLFEI